jgi:ppGpp synthetase/RelA/SpoT-type nucleotidyltranferase
MGRLRANLTHQGGTVALNMTTYSPALPPRKQIEALGDRLRDSAEAAEHDLHLLEQLLLIYDEALGEAAERLRSSGLEPTTRLKTSGMIIEKLRRERHLTLRSIRDLAGARIVKRMTLDEQDQMAALVQGLWPGARLIDRRAKPSHGYRAVHIVPRVRYCPVEIQIRTLYQDGWAQTMETLGDH